MTCCRVFRRLDAHGDLIDDGFGSISRLLRDRPWVVPWDEWKPAGMPGRRGPDDYRELRRRVGLSLEDFMDLFPNNAAAEAWFIQHRWSDGVRCHASFAGICHPVRPQISAWRRATPDSGTPGFVIQGWVQGWILSMENGGYRSLAKQLYFHQWTPFHPRIQIPVTAQLPVNFRDNCPTLAFVQDGCSSS